MRKLIFFIAALIAVSLTLVACQTDVKTDSDKFDKDGYYTKDETDELLLGVVGGSDYYTKAEIDALLSALGTEGDFYTKSEIDALIDRIDTDESGYYTKEQIDELIAALGTGEDDCYTKAEIDELLAALGKDSNEQDVTEGLAFYPLPDGTYAVGAGNTIYMNEIKIPSTYRGKAVTAIVKLGFYGAENLTEIEIPDGVTSIGESAFAYCTSLTGVGIPASVTKIGEDAFDSCESLRWVDITDIEAWCNISFESSSANPLCYAGELCLNYTPLTELVIPENITSISAYTFQGCTSLLSVEIPDSVNYVGYYAFSDCNNLANVKIGKNVETIDAYAFGGCLDLSRIEIPDSVTVIGEGAFIWCDSLSSVTIGKGVEYVGEDAFRHCDFLKKVYISDVGAWCGISFGNSYSNPLSYTKCFYSGDELVTEIVIPRNVTSVNAGAFRDCESLTSIKIPDSVTFIGADAFDGCENLTIYCEAEKQPAGWDYGWNYNGCPVEWGCDWNQ